MEYVALLRGINVGGNNKVVMSELREQIAAEGFTNVRTYINSGNLLFEAGPDTLREDFYRQVTIRSGSTVEKIAAMLSQG